MNKKNIVVIFGGQSPEHEVSLNSASMIISNMNEEKYYIIPIGITKEGQWLIYDGPVEHIKTGEWKKYGTPAIISPDATQKSILKIIGDKIKKIPVDVIFPVLHGKWGEDGTIQGLFEMAQIPYVGDGVLSSCVSMDKVFTKMIAKSVNIEQAKYLWFYTYELEHCENILNQIEKELQYPCFIKPANTGSSVGITKAHNREELKKALYYAAKFDTKVIAEEFIDGREIECSVLGNENPIASGVGEIFSAAEFYDYDAKYNNAESKTVVPAELDKEITDKIRKIAIKIFKAVEGTGLARVDFLIQKNTNRIIFNELNTMPGFTSISMYPMLWEAEGKSKELLIDELITLAFSKQQCK
ncbi:MAG: D-alanine--D-alanine ligase [Firmicutes bacterium]|jgi:D-alanine-D-alanine ligase|nr:D-alanine--D-alanine ligase [Bacillota bacterium]